MCLEVILKHQKEKGRVNCEYELGDSPSLLRNKLRENFDELNAVFRSGYVNHLNPEIVSRMKKMLARSYD
jgi:hypothetical protein